MLPPVSSPVSRVSCLARRGQVLGSRKVDSRGGAEHDRAVALTLKLRSGDISPLPELSFDAPRVVIGRAPGCELQLPDPSISSRHASLRQRGSEYVVVDEGSENGTFVGATRLGRQAPHSLANGDLLRFGRVWVEVRLDGAAASEAGASRELARQLVEHALEQEQQPWGMSVQLEGESAALALVRPRHAYLIGSHAAADLQLAEELPARCLELRRQGDQLWVTLLDAALEAHLDERRLELNARSLWPRGTRLSLGETELSYSDPTAQVLERLERDSTERLPEDVSVDPPAGRVAVARYTRPIPSAAEEPAAPSESQAAKPVVPRRLRSWTLLDAVVCVLALSLLGLSLWAIRWVAALGRA
jgi:predicted component of type VI protein secretion system